MRGDVISTHIERQSGGPGMRLSEVQSGHQDYRQSALAFIASHPNNFAYYSFTLVKGANALTPPSVSGLPVSPPPTPVVKQFGPIGNLRCRWTFRVFVCGGNDQQRLGQTEPV